MDTSNEEKIIGLLEKVLDKIDVIEKLFKHEQTILPAQVESKETTKQTKSIKFEKLLSVLKTDLGQIYNIIDMENNEFRIISNIEGKSDKNRMVKAALIILTLEYYLSNIDSMNSKILVKKIEELGIQTNRNLSKYLKENRAYFIEKKSGKARDITYKITIPGLTKGIENIKELLKI